MRLAKASPAPRRRRWPVLVQQRSRALWPQQAGDNGRDGKRIQHWKFLKLGKQRERITVSILTGFEQNPMLPNMFVAVFNLEKSRTHKAFWTPAL